MGTITVDFETRSHVNIKTCGADIYATDPSTDIICLSVVDGGDEWLWYAGQPVPPSMVDVLERASEIKAHNARFDKLIYECIAVPDYGLPPLVTEKWVCTAAQCRVNALPASLDGATRAANNKHKKDHTGSALIRKLSIPNKAGEFNYDPKLIAQMGEYCVSDSVATSSLSANLRQLSETDKLDWQVNERINDRGVKVDLEMAALAQQYAETEKTELGARLWQITNGTITAVTQTQRLLPILLELWADQDGNLLKCITKFNKDPAAPVKYTLDKTARGLLLDNPTFTGKWREVIELIDQGGNSSVSKFAAMLHRADPETGRVHGAFIFAGAGQTQRYSSKGLQLHNMRRDCWSPAQSTVIKGRMAAGTSLKCELTQGLEVMDILAKALRPTIIPADGHKFVVGDWSAIEARVLPWLSNSKGGDEALDIFRSGRDVYVETAASMGMDDRQLGKVANLSLGFGGAAGAFNAMAKNYGISLPLANVKIIVNRWRAANPWAVKFWGELEQASIKAVRKPLTEFKAGRVSYVYVPQLLDGTLMCILPDQTVIQYPYAKIEQGSVTAMKASVQPKADSEDEWPRMRLWGGFLAENVTQATAACLLRGALREMDVENLPVVAHAHDEVILEVPANETQEYLGIVQDYMEYIPDWATGLPLKAEPVVMDKYGK